MLRLTSPFVPNSVDKSALMVKVRRPEGKYGCRRSPFRGRLLPQLPRCQAGSQDSVVGMNIRLCVCSTQLGAKHIFTAKRSHDRRAQFRLVPCKFGLLSPSLAFDFPMTNSARESSKHEEACRLYRYLRHACSYAALNLRHKLPRDIGRSTQPFQVRTSQSGGSTTHAPTLQAKRHINMYRVTSARVDTWYADETGVVEQPTQRPCTARKRLFRCLVARAARREGDVER